MAFVIQQTEEWMYVVLSSQEHVSLMVPSDVAASLQWFQPAESFKRELWGGNPFLLSGYAKKRLLSSTVPGSSLMGGLVPVCGNMRLVEGRSGPAFIPYHPLMLQRSNPVWTNWEEPGVVRGQDAFSSGLLGIFPLRYIFLEWNSEMVCKMCVFARLIW